MTARGAGPSLKYNGAVYAAGQFGGWSPISAEKTASGYLVAWKAGRRRPVQHLDHRQ